MNHVKRLIFQPRPPTAQNAAPAVVWGRADPLLHGSLRRPLRRLLQRTSETDPQTAEFLFAFLSSGAGRC